jgi:hypothetical protein
MLLGDGIITRFKVRVKALLSGDWTSKPGDRFRKALGRISRFADEHDIDPHQVLGEGVELSVRKLRGLASQEHATAEKNYAEAAKNFADAEDRKIESELKRRSMESKIRKEEFDARLTELKVLDAEVELLKKLKELGVIPYRDNNGNLTILPLPPGVDMSKLVDRRLKDARDDAARDHTDRDHL